MTRLKWTREAVLADARRFASKRQWQLASGSAYTIAHRRGWLDEACAHMSPRWQPRWDKAAVLASAKKHSDRTAWKTAELGAYKAAQRNGWMLEACAHMEVKHRDWTLESLKASAASYPTRGAWKEADGAAYKAARDHGLLEEVCAHMVAAYKPAGWWTKSRVLASAREHPSIASWDAAETSAYQQAKKMGWMAEATAHMHEVPMPIGPATIHEFLIAHGIEYKAEHRFKDAPEVSRMPFDFYLPGHNLVIEYHGRQHRDGWSSDPASRDSIQHNDRVKREWALRKGLAYVAICAWIDRTLDQVRERVTTAIGGILSTPRVLTEAERRKIWSGRAFEEEEILADAAQYPTRAAWMRSSPNAYRFALRHGLSDAATRHMAYVTEHGKWTRETVIASAQPYSSLAEWREANPSAHVISKRLGCFEEATQHMTRAKQPNGYWTDEKILAEAARFDNTAAWNKGSPISYGIAKRRRLVPATMQRGKRPKGYWTKERISAAAALFKTRSAFRKAEPSAYAIAGAKGWLEEVCAHMLSQRRDVTSA